MEYVRLGKTGIRVSRLCLGTMTFGNEADEETAVALMNRAIEAGINFFDTANVYNGGRTEEIVGRWLRPRREEIILASKVHFPVGKGVNEWGNSRRHILMEVEKSLRRLNTDWLDMLYLHHWDDETALDESLGAVTTLIEQGKVHYCAVSNFSAWQTMKAVALARERNLAPVVCLQPMYNLLKRQVEVEILPVAASEGLAVCPYSPLAAGMLTGKYLRGETGRIHQSAMYKERYKNPEYAEVSKRFVGFAEENGFNPGALAVAWVYSHPAVTSAIIGARNMRQMNETLGCLKIDMSVDLRATVTALSVNPPLATDRENMETTIAQVKAGSHTKVKE